MSSQSSKFFHNSSWNNMVRSISAASCCLWPISHLVCLLLLWKHKTNLRRKISQVAVHSQGESGALGQRPQVETGAEAVKGQNSPTCFMSSPELSFWYSLGLPAQGQPSPCPYSRMGPSLSLHNLKESTTDTITGQPDGSNPWWGFLFPGDSTLWQRNKN